MTPPLNQLIKKYDLLLLLVVTLVAYFPGLNGNYLNWDDFQYIVNNPDVKLLTMENIVNYFTKAYNNTYVPLTMLSWAVELKIFGYQPMVHLLVNLLLHLGTVWVVYGISRRLFSNSLAPLLIASVFALHPVHVESVSWITERKDVLFGLFFFLSLDQYIRHLDEENKFGRHARLALIFFVLALFSKGQAVALAPVIVLTDIFKGRFKFSWRYGLSKLPWFALAIIFGLLAIHFQSGFGAHAQVEYQFSPSERMAIAAMAFIKYLYITILPYQLNPANPLPKPGIPLPDYFYLAILIFPTFVALIFLFWKKNKEVAFGMTFFVLTLVLMLDHTRVGIVLFADRFLYVPIFGFGIITAVLFRGIYNRFGKTSAILIIGILLAFYAIKTNLQSRIWNNLKSLSEYSLSLDDNNPVALYLRSDDLVSHSQYDSAYILLEKAHKIHPNLFQPAYVSATCLKHMNKFNQANQVLTELIRRYPKESKLYYSRSNVLMALNRHEEAKKDIDQMLQLDPHDRTAQTQLAFYYHGSHRINESIKIIKENLRTDPDNIGLLYLQAKNYLELGKADEAMHNIQKAIQLSEEKNESDLYQLMNIRSEIYGRLMGNFDMAEKDATTSIKLNPWNDVGYNNLAMIKIARKDFEGAEQLLKKAIEINPTFCEALVNITILYAQEGKSSLKNRYLKLALDNGCDVPPVLLK